MGVLPDGEPFSLTQDVVTDEDSFGAKITEICEALALTPKTTDEKTPEDDVQKEVEPKVEENNELLQSVPMVGDSVMAHYCVWQFFPASVESFDVASMKYTV